MTNREMFEYFKMCDGEELDLDKVMYNSFLDSEISVKDVYLRFKKCGIEHERICDTLSGIFYCFKADSAKEKVLKIVNKALINCDKYFKDGSIEDYVYKVIRILNYKDISIENLEHRLKIYNNMVSKVSFKDMDCYEIKEFENYDGSKYISFKSDKSVLSDRDILGVGAIMFKNGKYKVYELKSKKDIPKINKIVMSLDYDICMCVNANKILDRLDKKVREEKREAVINDQ